MANNMKKILFILLMFCCGCQIYKPCIPCNNCLSQEFVSDNKREILRICRQLEYNSDTCYYIINENESDRILKPKYVYIIHLDSIDFQKKYFYHYIINMRNCKNIMKY